MRSLVLPHALVLSFLFVLTPPEARAAHAVPPVPNKQGEAPREGFSKQRLHFAPPGIEGGAARAPLASKQAMDVLGIRVAFSDTPIDSSSAYFDRLLFFMKQYWEHQTEGAVTFVPTLHDSVFTLSHPMSYYGDDERFQERLVFLVRDVVRAADSTVDFRPYESIVIFHAGQGQEADVLNNSQEEIWSAFVTRDDFEDILPDLTGAVGIKTNDELSPGVFRYIDEAVEVPESESQDGYQFGMTGVTCHEFGHQLGLPDLYDTNGSEGGDSQGLASWDIMATGVWNFNGHAPAGLSAWSRQFLGLIAPLRVVSDGPVSLSMLERQVDTFPRAAQIPMTQSEYLLLENRRQDLNGNGKFDFDDQNGDGNFDFYLDSYAGAEWDFFLPGDGQGSGMLIYHVDEATIAAGLPENVVNAVATRKGIDIVEADGIEDLDGPITSFSAGSPDDVFRAGWRDKLTPTTTPSTEAYGHARTGISITGISAPESIMTFNAAFERLKPGWPKLLAGKILNAPALVANLGGTGTASELIVPVQINTTGAVYVFNPDGSDFLDGDSTPTPFATTSSGVSTSPCVGDIDGVPGNELVFSTLNGTLYAFHADGTEVVDGDSDPLTTGVLTPGGGLGVHAQPVLAELDGNPGLEIVIGHPANIDGFSFLRAITLTGGAVQQHSIPVGGSSEAPVVVADLDGNGTPEVIAVARAEAGENALPGLYFSSWEIFTDPILPLDDPGYIHLFKLVDGYEFSSPVAVDLDRDGRNNVIVADGDGAFHAFRFAIAPHIPGDSPASFVSVSELVGWPARFPGAATGRTAEISVADLEGDGYPEVFQTGDDARVAALHWSGSPRSGYPLRAAALAAPADSTGFWAPLIADVNGDNVKDVIPILPDGRRPAYRADGTAIPGFVELGSTGGAPPPILADLEGDGPAEWIETFDAATDLQVTVRTPPLPISSSSIAWGQYRLSPTRNAVVAPGAIGPGAGTQTLADVYVYPNPSRDGESRVHYRLGPTATSVSVRIYDGTGALVADLPMGPADLLGSSEHAIVWAHRSTASGVYLCRVEVESGGRTEVRFATLGIIH